jgi:hypothetical protein
MPISQGQTSNAAGSWKRAYRTMLTRLGNRQVFAYGMLVLLGLILPGLSASSQTINRWREPESYDTGDEPSIAVLPSGLVVEFHRSPLIYISPNRNIWYHIGKISEGKINWGDSIKMSLNSATPAWPQVMVTPQGRVLFTYSDNLTKSTSDLICWVGTVDPNGDTSQTINWTLKDSKYDSGFHNSLMQAPFYTGAVFVDVHENRGSGDKTYYRIGELTNSGSLFWFTGKGGVHYGEGINPHIAISPDNEIVEVHQAPRTSYLHYRRGRINVLGYNLSEISFRNSNRYNDSAERPTANFIGPLTVLEFDRSGDMRYRIGTLSRSNPNDVNWDVPQVISVNDNDFTTPAVATSGSTAVAVFEKGRNLYYTVASVE